MKKLVLVALISGFAASVHAVPLPGIAKNVVMSCSSGNNHVVVLSDNYTTTARGKLAASEDNFYVVKGQLARDGSEFSIRGKGKAMLLRQVEAPGWLSKGIGVYENQKYRMDLQSLQKESLTVEDLESGEVLTCRAYGDCC